MSAVSEAKMYRTRVHAISCGIWAERAVVRALEIDPDSRIQSGLLFGQPTAQIALTIARAVGYLAGTQRAPELAPEIRAWIDQVAKSDGTLPGGRLGNLSWPEWAERASIMALEIGAEVKVESIPLRGQRLWEIAITIARAVACIVGRRRECALPAELIPWLQGAPPLGPTGEDVMQSKEESR